ncbi:6-carboxytetrahydropterin synthase [Candidatus Nitrospira inopinata]|jgi:6-pyruvoyltetrahydropterin/6-carboxytetrahydropterin synthase|uniref:6-carboxy-5,6,7,8-tetrahydropterin synthase n=1 Tax=Candidatus Nitrospira inopinata TaxID=1715989 RepID=A0A0S4KS13_9BACT|nr:6-carboxytetrahydropterin synthase [Candidatus Nitrospira inopinata]CUQ65950.1 6-carboxy-5,6,7,8-tetrahydropterin synthase [Candidatus Nitrospira inopinata]
MTITRRYRFCAAHRLHSDRLTEDENQAAFGKCNNPNGHGHNYVVLVTINGDGENEDQEIASLDRTVAETVLERFDHHDLNCDSAFTDCTTTGENLVKLIWDLLEPKLLRGKLSKVGVIETRDNYFEYAGMA